MVRELCGGSGWFSCPQGLHDSPYLSHILFPCLIQLDLLDEVPAPDMEGNTCGYPIISKRGDDTSFIQLSLILKQKSPHYLYLCSISTPLRVQLWNSAVRTGEDGNKGGAGMTLLIYPGSLPTNPAPADSSQN